MTEIISIDVTEIISNNNTTEQAEINYQINNIKLVSDPT